MKVCAGQRSVEVERSDGQGQDQTRLSDDIVHHNCRLSYLGRSPLLLYGRAHRLALRTVSRRIGRRRTTFSMLNAHRSKWYVFFPHPPIFSSSVRQSTELT